MQSPDVKSTLPLVLYYLKGNTSTAAAKPPQLHLELTPPPPLINYKKKIPGATEA